MGLRDRLKRLEKQADGETVAIRQKDGTVVRFPAGADGEAFVNLMSRLGAGEDAPPEHPLIAAARNSSDPKWSGSFVAAEDPERWVLPVEDLSE
jgi:hypothetical protein